MRHLIYVTLVTELLACSTLPTSVLPGTHLDDVRLAQATSSIWQTYGGTGAPVVRVAMGSDLTCTDAQSGQPGFDCPGVGCREGCTLLDSVVSWDGVRPWSQTALAHELQHQRQTQRGIFDPHHRRGEWEPGGLADQANEQLRREGL